MADISKIKTPNGTTYDIVDREARRIIAASQIINSASGAIVSFSDGADDIPVRRLSVDLEPVQDLHGYDHPWPAGGGKNLLPYAIIESPLTKNGITFVRNQDGSIAVNGTSTASFAQTFVEFSLQPGSYYFNCGNSFSMQQNTYAYIRDTDNGITLATINAASIGTDRPFSIDVQTNVRFYMVFGSTDLAISGTLYPMIRLASVSDATYAPYENICPISGHDAVTVTVNGTDYPTDLPTTVYGGTLDVVSGELVVDRAMVDLGTLTWLYKTSWASFGVFTREQSEAKTFVAESKLNCSDYSQTATNTSSNAETVALMSDGQIQIKQGSKQIYIRDSRYTDATVFKAAMQGVQLVYELATPQTHHLTSQEVRTLLGTNNVWSDANSVFVEYDTKNSVVAFTSSDVADGDASSWTTVTKVASGEKRSSLFAKMSQMFKNIRYLYKLLGTTDISSIGDGTVTGGLSSLAESQQAQKQLYIQQLKDLCLFAEIANGN